MCRSLARLVEVRSGAAALEFALVCLPFVALLVGSMSVAYDLYVQFALDYALQHAVRQVQLGLVPAMTTSAEFTGNVFCPVFVVFAPCTAVIVSVQPVADYYNATAVTAIVPPTAFCVGHPGQLMYARAVYRAPVLGSFYAAIGISPGTDGNTIVSAGAFANENPSGAALTDAAGC